MISIDAFLPRAERLFSAKSWFYFYSGYQWRSEPNVGIVTNLDFIKCRTRRGKTVYDRDQLLCVHWPRIFWDHASPVRAQLTQQLNAPRSPLLTRLSEEAYRETGITPNVGIIRGSGKTFGAWSDRATVARIYRDVCDLIILNDAVILGNKWGDFIEA